MTTTNGATNGDTNGASPSMPATHLLATFVANAQTSDLTPDLRTKVKEVLLDTLGVTAGALHHAESTEPILKAITAFQGPSVTKATPGVCTVVGQGVPKFLPHYAGLLNAALGHSLDFDDTHAEGTLHAGVTGIPAALAAAEALAGEGRPPSAEEVMLAISVGYEITCRLGRELGFASYDRGFHNTGTCGIFGAVSAICVLRHLDVKTVEMAYGLAGSKAAGSMQYLANGSWNKRLHPGFAVHDAFLCVQLAESGVIGATEVVEGKNGFLKAYSPSADKDLRRLVSGLGLLEGEGGNDREWMWLRSALKPYPACRMTHAFIELCGHVHDAYDRFSPESVASIQLTMSPSNFILIGDPTHNKRHPSNAIDAQFSAYFQVANALLYGAKTGDMSPYSRLSDTAIHALTNKIEVQTDKSMSGFAAKMKIQRPDGREEDAEQQFPLGEVQHPFTKEKVEEKFLAMAVNVWGNERSRKIIRTIDELEQQEVTGLIELLR